ncbi:uncharacterized protein A4U43_C05F23850 [Asparagus officinalis]|uniref:aminodeoxychorismate synthase n=1 Tax=Asparagus officinalis TaxID=4686 RepID=A0A5P1EYF3_ASPOF|nr:uncharacterized protein A4U43_C05F23850 [Asparagus officinalis]
MDVPPVVIRNDEWTVEHVLYMLYEEKAFDNVVISPGPGSPACSRDIGICLEILRKCEDIPILGVCLGHQALGFVHGAKVVHAPEPVHGLLSEIEHNECDIFQGIPSGTNSGFEVVRYHSLVIDADSLPKELIAVAWTTSIGAGISNVNDVNNFNGRKVLMGVKHLDKPHYGVQFHPESIATRYGRQMFENFKQMTVGYGLSHPHIKKERVQVSYACQSSGHPKRQIVHRKEATECHLHICNNRQIALKSFNVKHIRLQWKKIDCLVSQVGGSHNIFCYLFGDENAEDTFWLDSSSTDQGRARFSFMGGRGGSLWKQLTFRLVNQSKQTSMAGGYLSTQDGKGHVKTEILADGLLNFLNKELQSFCYDKEDYEGLPFDFFGGFIGYFGFLRLDGNGKLEAKPIKGTVARGRTLEEDEHLRLQLKCSKKDRAENLMIVDLLRNDLGRVCEPGSVSVPHLMEIESYATVHTMVSTIQGQKSSNISPVDCIRAAFPGGSMTGAPKLRSMELLDSLENSSRGVYSGSIGFLSYNQTFDLNIVIRTVIIHEGEASVGAGGAIVALSNPEEEYEEMMLKAKVPTMVVDEYTTSVDSLGRNVEVAI